MDREAWCNAAHGIMTESWCDQPLNLGPSMLLQLQTTFSPEMDTIQCLFDELMGIQLLV